MHYYCYIELIIQMQTHSFLNKLYIIIRASQKVKDT